MLSITKLQASGLPPWRSLAAALVVGMALLLGGGAQVNAAPVPAGAVIRSIATATYTPSGLAQTETISSNEVIAVVLPVEALALTQDQSVGRPPPASSR